MRILRCVNILALVGMLAVMGLVASDGFATDHERWAAIGLVLVYIATVGGSAD